MTTELNTLRNRWLLILTAFFIAIGLAYTVYWLSVGQFYENTDDAYVGGNLIQIMPQISGKVSAILTDETDHVVKGQPIILLDPTDAQIALENAKSELAFVARQVSELYNNVDQLKANIAVQQLALEKAEQDYQRRYNLSLSKSISTEDLKHAENAKDSAIASLELAKQQLKKAIDLVSNTDLYHHPQVLQAITRLRDAYLTKNRTTLFAPETGYVALRSVQVGQQVTTDSVLMIIVSANQTWVYANFREPQLKNIRVGQPATLFSDLYGSDVKYQGTVVGLSPGTGSVFDLLPPQNATGNWIKIVQRLPVRIALNPNELSKNPLKIGLSMLVTIDTHNRAGNIDDATPHRGTLYQTENYSDELNKADALAQKILQDNAKNLVVSALQ